MGGMKIRKNITYKILLALLFPPAIFAIQFKSAKELQYMPQTQEEHEQDLENKEDSTYSYQTPDLGVAFNGLNARNAKISDEDDEAFVDDSTVPVKILVFYFKITFKYFD
jgi:hypothetical protein